MNRDARVAGVDEAGRGPLAGPVVCAAVILDPSRPIAGLNDSKALTEHSRERLFPIIQRASLAWHVEFVEREEIDALNILWATMEGMRRAIHAISPSATRALIDGDRVPPGLPCPAVALVGGDGLEPSIMAASILAKVSRDRHMLALHDRYPGYGFERNKGYPTAEHLASLARLGPCPEHRRSFAPVRNTLIVSNR
ncbi:MAG: ribonuclease HII [Arenimonas sp.]|nr:ribonuclease HII [Arenimonas sp.]